MQAPPVLGPLHFGSLNPEHDISLMKKEGRQLEKE
jgi:hypothetical protein